MGLKVLQVLYFLEAQVVQQDLPLPWNLVIHQVHVLHGDQEIQLLQAHLVLY